MNKVILMGRLTKDPTVRWTQSNPSTCIAAFSIAVDRRYKRDGEPDADFFNCTAFGKPGEFVEKYLHKGTKIILTGRIQNDTYTNKDGQKVTATKIIADEIEFAESKSATKESNEETRQQSPDGFMNVDGFDDELPFA